MLLFLTVKDVFVFKVEKTWIDNKLLRGHKTVSWLPPIFEKKKKTQPRCAGVCFPKTSKNKMFFNY